MTTSVNLAPNSEHYTLGPDIPVNTGFFQILPVILVTQQYILYLGLPGRTVYLLLVILHPLQSFQQYLVTLHPLQSHRVWCRGRCHCATFGIAVAVIVQRVVSRSPSLHHVWCHRRCRCAVYGVTVAVIAPRVALRSPSLRRVWCRGRCRCAAYGVAVAVVAPRLVSPSLSLCSGWCRRRRRCAAGGVAVAVVAARVASPSLHRGWRRGWTERTAVHPSAREVEGGRALRSEVEKRKKKLHTHMSESHCSSSVKATHEGSIGCPNR